MGYRQFSKSGCIRERASFVVSSRYYPLQHRFAFAFVVHNFWVLSFLLFVVEVFWTELRELHLNHLLVILLPRAFHSFSIIQCGSFVPCLSLVVLFVISLGFFSVSCLLRFSIVWCLVYLILTCCLDLFVNLLLLSVCLNVYHLPVLFNCNGFPPHYLTLSDMNLVTVT